MSSISLLDDGWDRTFLKLSSYCAEPLCWAYGMIRYKLIMTLDPDKFDNSSSKIVEIGKRVLIGVGAFFAFTFGIGVTLPAILTLGCASKLLRAIGFALQKNNYTHIVTGTPEEVVEGPLKVVTINLLGVAGRLHLDHGGVNAFNERLQTLVKHIRESKAHVVILEEVYDTLVMEALCRELGGEFAHIFAHMGQSAMGSAGGLMVLSKCAVHRFDNEDFDNSTWQLRRGFATIEVKRRPEDRLPCARVIGIHLIHNDESKREEQVAQIINGVARRTLSLPTIVAGDSNVERDSKEGELLKKYLQHGYLGDRPTCTNKMTAQWYGTEPSGPDEIIDIISLVKRAALPDGRVLPVVDAGISMKNCRIIELFDSKYDTKTAASDHNGLYCEIDV